MHLKDNRPLIVEDVVKHFHQETSRRLRLPWQKPAPPAKPNERLVKAVDHVSFEVERKEIYGILGPNGSGKSTLIRLLCTLLIPDGGRVTVFGYDVQQHEMTVKHLINRVSVDAAFFKKL
ncbi:MAG: ATP-binding cassette domain-containing protein, partial [Anaerolineae bacterium]|nr:ATP-binding cassette domain-containing protein [Anaerolineae bacterium]